MRRRLGRLHLIDTGVPPGVELRLAIRFVLPSTAPARAGARLRHFPSGITVQSAPIQKGRGPFLALRTQLALRPDVPVDGRRGRRRRKVVVRTWAGVNDRLDSVSAEFTESTSKNSNRGQYLLVL